MTNSPIAPIPTIRGNVATALASNCLRRAMEAEGFAVFSAEWWHFDYKTGGNISS